MIPIRWLVGAIAAALILVGVFSMFGRPPSEPLVEVVVNATSLGLGENMSVRLDCASCKIVVLINRTFFEEGGLYIIYVYADGCFYAYSPTQRMRAEMCRGIKLQHSVDNAPKWPTNYTLYLTSRGARAYTIVVKATTYQDPDYGPFCRPW